MNNGYIKLHRKIINDEIFDNANLLKVWVWFLCKASHKERTVSVGLQSVELAQGQFITGRDSAAAELNMKPTTAWRYLKKLEKCGNLDIKSNNKFSLVTVEKWAFYQVQSHGSGQQNGQQMDIKWTSNGQQMDTNKNVKNEKNVKNYYSLSLEDRLQMAGVIRKETT